MTEEGLFVVPVKSGATFLTEPPRFLFKVKPFGGRLGADFEVSPDGRRFIFILDGPPAAASPAHLVFVQHWVEELRARLAEGGIRPHVRRATCGRAACDVRTCGRATSQLCARAAWTCGDSVVAPSIRLVALLRAVA